MTKSVRRDSERGLGRGARVRLALLGACVLISAAAPVLAQGFQWPWQNNEPHARPSPRQAPPARGSQYGSQRSAICLQLEQRLVQDQQRGSQGRQLLPQIEADIRQSRRNVRKLESRLERANCYEQFLFSRELRRTRRCLGMAREKQAGERRLRDLDTQRQRILNSRGRSYQDDIIRELARNRCGSNYVREARRRDRNNDPFSSFFWQDQDTDYRGSGNNFGTLPFATYRTLCVRLCDGYYFPISFSTLPNHFQRDADLCQSKCAAPVELYYHQNPGSGVDQMVAIRSNRPYTELETAFTYRKEYVNGCSCKNAEYSPQEIAAAKQQPEQPVGGSTAQPSAGPPPAPQPAQKPQ